MAKVSYKDLKPELTSDELQEIENAAARTILYDEECPEMTEEMLKQFKRMNQKGRDRKAAAQDGGEKGPGKADPEQDAALPRGRDESGELPGRGL